MTPILSAGSHVAVNNLRVEYLENPLGIDIRQPHLSWQLSAEKRNVTQKAYQIQAAATLSDFEAAKLLWDSGKIQSDNTISVRYAGAEGQTGERIFWRVKVWDQDDNSSSWSEPAWWEMGLLDEKDWQADWIEVGWDETPKALKPSPFFRRAFTLSGNIKSARLYITAHGLYEAWLNGQRVGDQMFTPGYTAYDKRLQYQVYDITTLLRQGENAIGAILGDGWYRGKVYVNADRNVYGERLGLLAQLHIETSDGKVILTSDAAWKAITGPIIKSDMRDGEIYDARLEMPGWSEINFDDSAWKAIRVVAQAKNHLVASLGVPIRRKEIFHPTLIKTPKGETVLDFGQNLAGVVHFKVRGTKGTTIRLWHGETLDQNGNFTMRHLKVSFQKEKELQSFQKVKYTLKGDGVEEFEPHFAIHGFRYVLLEGYPGEPDMQDFYSVAIYSDMPPTGTFNCSDPLINQLHQNTVWSMKSNFLDLPTDCPQRERAGWTGDPQIFAPSASYLMDTRAFFRKWLTELHVEQYPDGKVSTFVPNPYRLVKTPFFNHIDGPAGWGDAAILIPWNLFKAYGDEQILRNQYESMQGWLDYVLTQAQQSFWLKKLNPRFWFDKNYRDRQRFIWDTGFHWGEWLEPGQGGPLALNFFFFRIMLYSFGIKTSFSPVVATAYFANSARMLAKIAKTLGKTEDAQKYYALAEQVKAAYVKEFIGKDGRINPDRQASYVRVLEFDLAPKELKAQILGHLIRLIRAAGNHIGTGFLSTPFICHVLSENGRIDVAYDLLNQKTIPSWLYPITKGATTIWETWEGISVDNKPQMSLNHFSPGSVVNFLHRKVAGINMTQPGYKQITIQPMPGGGLTAAKADYESVHGLIGVEWAQENNKMTMKVVIPPNTRATVILPGASLEKVTEGGVPLKMTEGITTTVQVGADTQLEIGSGKYNFEYLTR
jgi:alpha-L-rhamnosidase